MHEQASGTLTTRGLCRQMEQFNKKLGMENDGNEAGQVTRTGANGEWGSGVMRKYLDWLTEVRSSLSLQCLDI